MRKSLDSSAQRVSHLSALRNTLAVAGFATLALLTSGCSRESTQKQVQDQSKQDHATNEPQKAREATVLDSDELPAVLRKPWKGDLNEIVQRRVLRVLVPYRRPEFFFVDGQPVGILQEAFQELEQVLNAKYKTATANRIVVAPLPTPIDSLRERMTEGYGDIAAFGISITEKNKEIADFTIPTMTGLKIIVVTGPGAPELKHIEDLSGKEVWVNPQTRLRDDISALNIRLTAQRKAPVTVREVDPLLEPGDVMEMVNAGTYPISLIQNQQAEFWGQVFGHVKVRPDLVVCEDVELGWAIQKNTPQLKAFLDGFITTHGVGTAFGNTLMRRYFLSAKYVTNATEDSELKKLRATEPVFREYAAKYDLDYLMMAAMGYQESRLDQNVKSPVGAVGIMQVMPATAASSPVSVANIHVAANNIRAGIRLIHFLIEDHFNEPGLDRMNRTLFALAAYNAGPEKIRRCRELAQSMNYNPNIWFGNVEVAAAKIIGTETPQYVANIYKYYVAYELAHEIRQRRTAAEKK